MHTPSRKYPDSPVIIFNGLYTYIGGSVRTAACSCSLCSPTFIYMHRVYTYMLIQCMLVSLLMQGRLTASFCSMCYLLVILQKYLVVLRYFASLLHLKIFAKLCLFHKIFIKCQEILLEGRYDKVDN